MHKLHTVECAHAHHAAHVAATTLAMRAPQHAVKPDLAVAATADVEHAVQHGGGRKGARGALRHKLRPAPALRARAEHVHGVQPVGAVVAANDEQPRHACARRRARARPIRLGRRRWALPRPWDPIILMLLG